MAAVADKLSFLEFQAKYGRDDKSYEYWHGEAIERSMPTSKHGELLIIIGELLRQAGYRAASDVELRIVPEARPIPDVIASAGEMEEPYPTKAVDAVVEVLSENDAMAYVLEKCQAYQDWGFPYIYVVNARRRQLLRWTGSGLEISNELTSIPASRIWELLDKAQNR